MKDINKCPNCDSKDIQSTLIQLSKLFKHGFTVEIRENKELYQYHNRTTSSKRGKPFIIIYNYGTSNDVKFINGKLPRRCIIGGKLNKVKNRYVIEIIKR